MHYIHYGRIGDIWKHLPLCSFLRNEKPRKYVETNAAFPIYELEKSVEQEYGIYTFFENAAKIPVLLDTPYYQEISKLNDGHKKLTSYLGSPGLAMHCLKDVTKDFIFFDLEQIALKRCEEYATKLGITTKVKVRCKDSVNGVYSLLPSLSSEDFIHFDPYEMWHKSNGVDYGDVFVEATKKGIKCMVWYGFYTLKQKQQVYDFFNQKLKSISGHNVRCIEVIMDIIEEDDIKVNPGIIGVGVLTSNLSQKSLEDMDSLSNALIDIYKGSFFGDYPGDLYKEELFYGENK